MLILAVLLTLINSLVAFHQTDYEFIHHRIEMISSNPTYFRNMKVELVPFNRTVRAFNATFDLLMDLTTAVPMSLQVYKLSMNDYRLFPFHLDVDFCKMRRENTFGINDLERFSNIPPCPIKKGYYYINKYRPDDSKFPPHLFPGDFKAVVKVMSGSTLLTELHWFGAIKMLEKL